MDKHLASLTLALAMCAPVSAEEMTVISYGGVSKDVQTEIFYKPFETAHQAKIIAGEYNGEMARIKAMVDTKSVNWDVVQVESDKLVRGCDEGLFEPLDQNQFGDAQAFVPETLSECGAGLLVWSMTLSYNANALKEAPQGWADFWDLEKFPGKRALQRGAKFTLEAALIADGVPRENVYEVLATSEGVDRAFAKLDKIKPAIQWWEAGAQPMQYLAAGDVVMTTAFNGRIFAAQASGAPIKPVWGGSIHAIDYWAIPKGSKHKALAQTFIASTLQPQAQKLHAEKLGYGAVNLQAAGLLDASVAPRLNTFPANIKQSLSFNNEFWVDHGEDLEVRFNAWLAKGN